MLWVDRYRPRILQESDYHKVLAGRLLRLAEADDFPHLLFYGPSGAGKKTRILGLLRALFGPGAEKVKVEQRTYSASSKNTSVDVTTVSSAYHIEMNPSESGYQDRLVVQEVIKEIAQSQPLEAAGSGARSFKVVVLNEVDKLSTEAQAGLRRTMEKYMRTCRLILVATCASKVIPAVRSRCLCLRIAAPTVPEIRAVLDKIAAAERIALTPQFATLLAKKANRNLRRAVLMLETAKAEQYPFVPNQRLPVPDWELAIGLLAQRIVAEQTPRRLLEVRSKLYELLVHCVPAEVVMRRLAVALLDLVNATLKLALAELAAFYEHRLEQGSKAIFHLEAFVAKFMHVYHEAASSRVISL